MKKDEQEFRLQLMLLTRYQLGEDLPKLSHHDRVMVAQHIAELDGYLTLQAPTDKVH